MEDVLRGDVRAVARAISLVENSGPEADGLLTALFPKAGRALVIGVTFDELSKWRLFP